MMRMILNKESMGNLTPGDRATIVGFRVDADLEHFLQRLYEVGFLVGEAIEVLHESPHSGDPISVRIKEATYALRREDANLVLVKMIEKAK